MSARRRSAEQHVQDATLERVRKALLGLDAVEVRLADAARRVSELERLTAIALRDTAAQLARARASLGKAMRATRSISGTRDAARGTSLRDAERAWQKRWFLAQLAAFGSLNATAARVGRGVGTLLAWRRFHAITDADVARARQLGPSREPVNYQAANTRWRKAWLRALASRIPDPQAAAIAAGMHPRSFQNLERRLGLELWSRPRRRKRGRP